MDNQSESFLAVQTPDIGEAESLTHNIDEELFDGEKYIIISFSFSILLCFCLIPDNNLLELMELDVASNNFSPFCSLCEALMYMLVNSPRPLVSMILCCTVTNYYLKYRVKTI